MVFISRPKTSAWITLAEVEMLLKEEFREPDTYFDILKAVSNAPRLSKIANIAGLNEKDMPKYLKKLEAVQLIERVNPITAKKEKSKTTFYFIRDNFLNFWFKFIFPNFSMLEERRVEETNELINNRIDSFFQNSFERFCQRLVKEKVILKKLNFLKIGRQWGKIVKGEKGKNTYEIDIIGTNETTKEVLFGECKWQDKVNPAEIAESLIGKAGNVKFQKKYQKEIFIIFAKSFAKKVDNYNNKKVVCFDLKDIEDALRAKTVSYK